MHALKAIADWANNNEGVLTLIIFVVTVIFGWVSGIFAALRRKPKLIVGLLDGPNFVCTFPLGRLHENHPTHRTAISLYLSVKNVGSSNTSLAAAWVSYRSRMAARPSRRLTLTTQVAALTDFQVGIGEHVKVYPFLFQQNSLVSGSGGKTYVQVGDQVTGVVYWEQPESWGGFFPLTESGKVALTVRVIDIFQRRYSAKVSVPMVTLEQAQQYNPHFGRTLEALRAGEQEQANVAQPDHQPPQHPA